MINTIPFTEGFNPLPSNIFQPPAFAEPTPLTPHDYEVVDVRPPLEMGRWPRLERLLGTEPIICPILYDEISKDAEYCRCDTCRNCFGAEALAEALKKSSSCPMCRGIWKEQVVYVNGSVARKPKESFWTACLKWLLCRRSN